MKNLSFITVLLIGVLLFSCKKEQKFPQNNEITGLASPVILNFDTTLVYLNDYFSDVSKIDSINFSCNIENQFDKKLQLIRLISNPDLPFLFEMDVWIDGFPWSVICRKSNKIKYIYQFDPKGKSYQSVQMKGEMNAWNQNSSTFHLENGIWKYSFVTEPGQYQYLLVLDGKEMRDPNSNDSVDNNIGGFNSLLKIGENAEDKLPVLFTLKQSKGKIEIGSENEITEYFALWQNFTIPVQVVNQKAEINIPDAAQTLDRSFIRVWACNKYGVSNDILIPLNKGKVIISAAELNRFDMEAMIIYNVFMDRFYDGDTSNNKTLNIKEVLPKADYHGGDLKGLTEKIKNGFFEKLGINTIWISPVVENVKGAYGFWPNPETKFSAYHGYWPVSYTKVDEHFGSANDLKEMVKTAHEKNINVLLDFVAHHVHIEHPYYKKYPDRVTNLYLPDGSLNTERWDDHRLTTWFDIFLPTLDLNNPEVTNMLADSAVYWIKEFNLDGFRHDATKHIPEIFWRTLTRKLKDQVIIPQNRKLYQIGETYGTRELIGSYIGSGQLDAQFDFNIYDASIAAFAKDDFSLIKLNESLLSSFSYFGWHHLMGNISGNQDRGRFISYAGGDLKFEENAKQAGWTRKIDVGNPLAYQKMKLLMAFNMTIPGVPVIYYGDEIGMPGGNDPDNRRMMKFENLTSPENDLRNTVASLANFRRNSLPMIYGDYQTLLVNDHVLVFARTYFDKINVIVINKSNSKQEISFKLPERFGKSEFISFNKLKFNIVGDKVVININNFGFDILSN